MGLWIHLTLFFLLLFLSIWEESLVLLIFHLLCSLDLVFAQLLSCIGFLLLSSLRDDFFWAESFSLENGQLLTVVRLNVGVLQLKLVGLSSTILSDEFLPRNCWICLASGFRFSSSSMNEISLMKFSLSFFHVNVSPLCRTHNNSPFSLTI